jgi:hypothetical protein
MTLQQRLQILKRHRDFKFGCVTIIFTHFAYWHTQTWLILMCEDGWDVSELREIKSIRSQTFFVLLNFQSTN